MSAARRPLLPGKRAVALRVSRTNDHITDETQLHARSFTLSSDRKRLKISTSGSCALAGNRRNTDWQSTFDEDIAEAYVEPASRRRYVNSDNNNRTWVEDGRPQEYLYEFMRLKGRRGLPETCRFCSSGDDAGYRCMDCFHAGLKCRSCFLHTHERLPFHRFEIWNGDCFERGHGPTIGLSVAVGHDDGSRCSIGKVARKFTILDTGGIFMYDIIFCNCEKGAPKRLQLLRAGLFPATARNPRTAATFRLIDEHEHLAAHGKISPYEHYSALERMCDAWRVSIPKSRLKSWTRIIRQSGFVTMLSRGGRGCFQDGVATTKGGQLAIACPACPREGVNIPDSWQTLPPEKRWRYRLMLMLDANFRLSNLRRNSTEDKGLHTGLAYFVEDGPYLNHIAKYPKQEDLSSCSGFKAMSTAETKDATGLRATGVAMCACIQHEMIRPRGVVDLQRGERQCNMDYAALSAAQDSKLDRLYSYDIACQWFLNLYKRIVEMPEHLRPGAGCNLAYAVPKCHCKGHKIDCQCFHSLLVQLGVGTEDAEGIERIWSLINHSAGATREQLYGHRHDTLDRRMATHNWEKTTGLGKYLHGRLETEEEKLVQLEAVHSEFTALLEPSNKIPTWEAEVKAWELEKLLNGGRLKDGSQRSPYWRERRYLKHSELMLKLAEQERTSGAPPIHDTSATACVDMGIRIEQKQRDIVQLLTSTNKDAPHIIKDIQAKRMTLQRDLLQFREVQRVYMPCIAAVLSVSAGERAGDIETETVYLPSSLSSSKRANGCADGLVEKEDAMREAQCFAALEEIRSIQRGARQLATFRKANIRGTLASGRSFDAQKRMAALTKKAVETYRAGRQALLRIRGHGSWETVLQVLDEKRDVKSIASDIFATDLSADLVSNTDELATSAHTDMKRKRGKHGLKTADTVFSTSDFFMSWIWRVSGAFNETDDDEMDGVLRIEWLKSRARLERSREQVQLLKDSRERTLLSLEYEANEWLGRASGWASASPDLAEGISAYCHAQALGRRRLAATFTALWATKAFHGHPRVADRIDLEEDMVSDSEDEDDYGLEDTVRTLADLPPPRPGMRDQPPTM
ncbi:hypothetical protein CYLTODRAFT_458896 [Cylindrobasidium torrendii FP15055 ss-10]|uniref:CxC2-like cysteine cluster KDZ transposase-associated domain-containing protein n=1 Tax=Cylindrobasidium torrendii FP15055 ss-10 TaxID=1314674 RepID=A0A0D7AXF6_9AGAR|nr:hypothetical protein CYLTODRAFT_458896 [Cylindrobasidium torrendii FP15055 ss-10]